jgi:hypothetical protein
MKRIGGSSATLNGVGTASVRRGCRGVGCRGADAEAIAPVKPVAAKQRCPIHVVTKNVQDRREIDRSETC